MSTTPPEPAFAPLRDASYMSLITYRRTGEPVATPVWFARRYRTLYVATMAQTGKVKRIRRDKRVRVAPCTARGRVIGPARDGRARVVADAAEKEVAEASLARKYGLVRRLYYAALSLARRVRGLPAAEQTYLAVEAL